MTIPLFDLMGKVAVVTGASRGIGQAVAEALSGAGAKVVISSRRQENLDPVVESIRAAGGEITAVVAHSGDRSALQSLAQTAQVAYGRIDILVNNAATNPHFGPMLDAEDGLWQKTIEVNIMGNIWLTQAVVPAMRAVGGGKIINIASVNGLRPGQWQGIYSMTKAAVISLTETLAMELAGDNIQVNAVAPGLVRTKFARVLWENEALLKAVTDRTPAHRIGEPEDISGIVLYLASGASNFATGQVFVVDGGLSVPML
ncbi:MAG: glucose 1-dehydrogenase [Anaerolineae bacterium]|nr:glucose 1-dehydrogenase [Anaerolineae bacterium]NUQ03290.1 glucose 1-dehydrogenase [Anaerolineae bacterium]